MNKFNDLLSASTSHPNGHNQEECAAQVLVHLASGAEFECSNGRVARAHLTQSEQISGTPVSYSSAGENQADCSDGIQSGHKKGDQGRVEHIRQPEAASTQAVILGPCFTAKHAPCRHLSVITDFRDSGFPECWDVVSEEEFNCALASRKRYAMLVKVGGRLIPAYKYWCGDHLEYDDEMNMEKEPHDRLVGIEPNPGPRTTYTTYSPGAGPSSSGPTPSDTKGKGKMRDKDSEPSKEPAGDRDPRRDRQSQKRKDRRNKQKAKKSDISSQPDVSVANYEMATEKAKELFERTALELDIQLDPVDDSVEDIVGQSHAVLNGAKSLRELDQRIEDEEIALKRREIETTKKVATYNAMVFDTSMALDKEKIRQTSLAHTLSRHAAEARLNATRDQAEATVAEAQARLEMSRAKDRVANEAMELTSKKLETESQQASLQLRQSRSTELRQISIDVADMGVDKEIREIRAGKHGAELDDWALDQMEQGTPLVAEQHIVWSEPPNPVMVRRSTSRWVFVFLILPWIFYWMGMPVQALLLLSLWLVLLMLWRWPIDITKSCEIRTSLTAVASQSVDTDADNRHLGIAPKLGTFERKTRNATQTTWEMKSELCSSSVPERRCPDDAQVTVRHSLQAPGVRRLEPLHELLEGSLWYPTAATSRAYGDVSHPEWELGVQVQSITSQDEIVAAAVSVAPSEKMTDNIDKATSRVMRLMNVNPLSNATENEARNALVSGFILTSRRQVMDSFVTPPFREGGTSHRLFGRLEGPPV